ILLTGGAGFIGFHVAKKLLEFGKKVAIMDNFSDYYDISLKKARVDELKKTAQKNRQDGSSLSVYKADVCKLKVVEKILKDHGITKICHLAAQPGVLYSLKNPFTYEKANVLGTLTVLEAARHNGADIVFASSSSVYGANTKIPFSESDKTDSPLSLYAATKKSAELMAYSYHSLYGIRCTGLRLFTAYGEFGRLDMAYFKFTKAIFAGDEIALYNNGNMKRDFTYVGDIVPAVITALEKQYDYEIFNLGNSKPIELKYLLACIEKECSKKAKLKFAEKQPGEVETTFADISKARRMLNFDPKTSIEEGIRIFVRWYKDYYKITN
ncbi:GDP-mannose 4,6-dehydratase, partial [Candidatus Peregrinibacteria bacterium]|nr:GDP-mannose 4,6-dehydratase [Candidatus Peregrinibacteria bacterium]